MGFGWLNPQIGNLWIQRANYIPNISASATFIFCLPLAFTAWGIIFHLHVSFLPFIFCILYKYTYRWTNITLFSNTDTHRNAVFPNIHGHSFSTRKYDYKWWDLKLGTLWLCPGAVDIKKHSMARAVIKSVCSESRWPELASQLCSLKAGGTWITETSCLKFLSCIMRTMIVPASQCCQENYRS